MAEWLRPATSVRCSCSVVGSNPIASSVPQKTTWYVDGRVNSRLRFYVAAAIADILKDRGQDGRVVKVSGLGEVLMFSRGIKSDHKF